MIRHETNSGMSSSFADLMTSIAVIFILLLCASMNNVREDTQITRNSVLAGMQDALREFLSGGIEVKSDPKDPLGLLVLVPEDLLGFKLDQAAVSPAGESFLKVFIPKLSQIVCSPQLTGEINSIVVEGHTDSTGTARHNWDLSQKRSMSVVRSSLAVLDEAGMTREASTFLQLLSASGRGSAELITDGFGNENPTLSRRVVFRLRFRSLEQKPILAASQSARTPT
ncbi:MAG TPA: OmpA family protein [Syntrophorhabdaceae bacterium]|nr:OmpA family protein [Syntrophorhabdaceae bacterium]